VPRVTRISIAIGVLAVWAFLSCQSDTIDPYYTSTFLVANSSATDLFAVAGFRGIGPAYSPVAVKSGGTAQLYRESRFLEAAPNAAQEFTCLSVYRLPDSALVYQMTPVTNGIWSRREVSKYDTEYTLKLTDGDLASGAIANACAQLTGVARDSLSGATLNALDTSYYDDAGTYRLRCITGSAKTYAFLWPDSLPTGRVTFYHAGYYRKTVRVPDGVDSLGNRYYRMNVRLAAHPAP
jgi:hypothetical protein